LKTEKILKFPALPDEFKRSDHAAVIKQLRAENL